MPIELFTKCPRDDATHLLTVALSIDGAFQSREYEFLLSRDRFDPVDFDAVWSWLPECYDEPFACDDAAKSPVVPVVETLRPDRKVFTSGTAIAVRLIASTLVILFVDGLLVAAIIDGSIQLGFRVSYRQGLLFAICGLAAITLLATVYVGVLLIMPNRRDRWWLSRACRDAGESGPIRLMRIESVRAWFSRGCTLETDFEQHFETARKRFTSLVGRNVPLSRPLLILCFEKNRLVPSRLQAALDVARHLHSMAGTADCALRRGGSRTARPSRLVNKDINERRDALVEQLSRSDVAGTAPRVLKLLGEHCSADEPGMGPKPWRHDSHSHRAKLWYASRAIWDALFRGDADPAEVKLLLKLLGDYEDPYLR